MRVKFEKSLSFYRLVVILRLEYPYLNVAYEIRLVIFFHVGIPATPH